MVMKKEFIIFFYLNISSLYTDNLSKSTIDKDITFLFILV